MVDKVELLPCPFCGGDAKTFGPYGWNSMWCISHNCRTFYNGGSEAFKDYPNEAYAITAWNTRLSPAPEGVDARELLAANIRPALVRFVTDHGADIDWRKHEAATQEIVGTVVAIQALSRPPAEQVRMREALEEAECFIAIMFGKGPDCQIPELVTTPIGAPVKLGDIMRAVRAALTPPPKGQNDG